MSDAASAWEFHAPNACPHSSTHGAFYGARRHVEILGGPFDGSDACFDDTRWIVVGNTYEACGRRFLAQPYLPRRLARSRLAVIAFADVP